MSEIYQYFVEGECEKKLIDTYKVAKNNNLTSGKVEVFNFINQEISNQRIAVLKPKTTIILVYDIDVENIKILNKNIKKLNSYGFKKIYHIQSIKNFEDEICFASNIKNINLIFNTVSKKDFKKEFNHCSKLDIKLKSIKFDINKIWSRLNSSSPFNIYSKQESLDVIRKKN